MEPHKLCNRTKIGLCTRPVHRTDILHQYRRWRQPQRPHDSTLSPSAQTTLAPTTKTTSKFSPSVQTSLAPTTKDVTLSPVTAPTSSRHDDSDGASRTVICASIAAGVVVVVGIGGSWWLHHRRRSKQRSFPESFELRGNVINPLPNDMSPFSAPSRTTPAPDDTAA